ncbi:pyridoxamine 5'-phosphate oxidase [Sulfuricaulis limicola]|uniref:Pyridoxamine 5'-phosphate oxidase n=1 Tax=Sulfuricaulis limicola TaxID=1620215 RepID=A0A1B4XJG2_9GAMM|nr:pyridoxamine 5'-phosphate oxidase family protein [Sulfuricaulis limicola]BAV34942.1 pyridoxamine 5'-phosphate oxidase [Sulfuricaulis limicola]
MTPSAKRFILDQLKKNRIMSLATVRSDGYPQATTVTYANDGLTLYFACDRSGQKVRNLRRSPKVSLTINKDTADWKKITGLSMGATAKVLDKPADTQRALTLLARKFKDMKNLSEEDLAETVFVRVQPKVVSILDYRRGFGWTKLVRV